MDGGPTMIVRLATDPIPPDNNRSVIGLGNFVPKPVTCGSCKTGGELLNHMAIRIYNE